MGGKVEADIHRVAGSDDVGLELQFRVGLALITEGVRAVSEFVANDENL